MSVETRWKTAYWSLALVSGIVAYGIGADTCLAFQKRASRRTGASNTTP